MAENSIKISDEVVAVLAREAALSVDGVYEMSSSIVDGIGELLGKKSAKKGIKVDVSDGNVILDLYVTVSYGCNIPEVAKLVQVKVKDEIESMTDFNVRGVNINVVNVKHDETCCESGESDGGEKGNCSNDSSTCGDCCCGENKQLEE